MSLTISVQECLVKRTAKIGYLTSATERPTEGEAIVAPLAAQPRQDLTIESKQSQGNDGWVIVVSCVKRFGMRIRIPPTGPAKDAYVSHISKRGEPTPRDLGERLQHLQGAY